MNHSGERPDVYILFVVIPVTLFLLTLSGSLALVYSARSEYERPTWFTDATGRRHVLNGPYGDR
jgi:hypothetical protein